MRWQRPRVLRHGSLAAFDGDYATTTVAAGRERSAAGLRPRFLDFAVHDRYLVRRLPALVNAVDIAEPRFRSHAYVESPTAGYMLAILDRGTDLLVASGRLGADAGEALKADARRRSDEGRWFGFIAYASVIGRKPA